MRHRRAARVRHHYALSVRRRRWEYVRRVMQQNGR